MMQDAGVGTVQPEADQPTMIFGTCELTASELRNGRRADLLELLMRHGVKRLAAERIIEIHCGDEANNTGRARSHPTSRGASSLR
jgi:hypothetical protein